MGPVSRNHASSMSSVTISTEAPQSLFADATDAGGTSRVTGSNSAIVFATRAWAFSASAMRPL